MENIPSIKVSKDFDSLKKKKGEEKLNSSGFTPLDIVDSSERSKVNDFTTKVDQGTWTEADEDVNQKSKCKYCKPRLSNLMLLEKIKARKSFNRLAGVSLKSHEKKKKTYRNKACQTSAGLFEKANMTKEEMKHMSLFLRLRNGKPKLNETFCKCAVHGKEKECRCGEKDKDFDWVWDSANRAQATDLSDNGRVVIFHKHFSCGTSAIRGTQALSSDQHFWEIKMTSSVYGTDMMIGVGTNAVKMNINSNAFCSMLGSDEESWGISYDGRVQHEGEKDDFCSRFGQGAIIGVHLDLWQGTLAFFRNRQALGTAYSGLRGRTLYPMACSTAARSEMKIISSCSFPSSLQFKCCQKLRQSVPGHLNVLEALIMPPGLKRYLANKLTWLLRPTKRLSPTTVCPICLPLKSVLDGLTDFEDSDDKEYNDLYLLVSSDEENSDEELGLTFPGASRVSKTCSSDCGEGTSSKHEDVSTDSDISPVAVKKFKHDNGKSHFCIYHKSDEEAEVVSEERLKDLVDLRTDESESNTLRKRLNRKRKR